jgi:hypothetical protein
MQVTSPVKQLIQQPGGLAMGLVRFVGSVKSVHASRVMRYTIDFKHLVRMACDFV